MSCTEVGERFQVSWGLSVGEHGFRGLSHRSLEGIESIGIDNVRWRDVAADTGISRGELETMAPAFHVVQQ